MATAPHTAPANLALSPAERAAVAAELARLTARVASLAARLDRLHTVMAAPERRAGGTRVVAAPITRVPAGNASRATAGPATAPGPGHDRDQGTTAGRPAQRRPAAVPRRGNRA